MLLHGISIADPANTNIHHDLRKIRLQEEKAQVQNKSMPHFTISEQDQLNNFQRFEYPSVKGYDTLKENTVPITTTVVKDIEDKHYAFRNEKKAEVEIPQLQATNYQIDESKNTGAFFDPKTVNPISIYKKTIRPLFHFIHPESERIPATDLYNLAKQDHFIYKKNSKSYQDRYMVNNSWRDVETGRISMFEQPRQATRLA